MGTVKRKPTRREQADASRRKVLEAARDAFVEHGFHGATMADIARRSGLAVQTVSYFFGTKPRLLSECIVATVMWEIGEAPAGARGGWEEAMAQAPSQEALIDLYVDGGYRILSGVSPLLDVARVGALTDPEVADVYHAHEANRRRDFEVFTRWLEEKGPLRAGLDHELATDVALSVHGFEVYLAFVRRGWGPDAIRAWMKDALKRTLLD